MINKVYNQDCIEGMKEHIPDDSFDLILTDPPFAINFGASKANYNRLEKNVEEGYAEVDEYDYPDFSLNWMREAKRVLKPSGSMFVFSGWNNLKDILAAAYKLDFEQINHIVWKYQFGVYTKRKFVTSHYHLLYYCLDDKKRKFRLNSRHYNDEKTDNGGSVLYRDLEDVWDIKREYWHNKVKTPTKLPYEIISKILDYTTDENDLVFDPFMGSGQTAIVSKMKSRRFSGFEISKNYHDIIQKRLDSNSYTIPSS